MLLLTAVQVVQAAPAIKVHQVGAVLAIKALQVLQAIQADHHMVLLRLPSQAPPPSLQPLLSRGHTS